MKAGKETDRSGTCPECGLKIRIDSMIVDHDGAFVVDPDARPTNLRSQIVISSHRGACFFLAMPASPFGPGARTPEVVRLHQMRGRQIL